MAMATERVNFSPHSMTLAPAPVPASGTASVHTGEPGVSRAELRRINRQLAAKNKEWGGLRTKMGWFRCPWPCTESQYEQVRNEAAKRWLEEMGRRGWDLKSKVYGNINKRRPTYGYSGDQVGGLLEDQVEIPMMAAFQKRKVERVRIEIPVTG